MLENPHTYLVKTASKKSKPSEKTTYFFYHNDIRLVTVNLLTAALALEGHTVCAFGYCGVLLVSAYSDGIQCAVVLGVHVVLAACYIAVN